VRSEKKTKYNYFGKLKNLIYHFPKNTYKMYISQNKKKEMDK